MSNPFANPWTVAHQAPLSMGFPRQEYWSGLPWPPPEDLPDPGIELHLLYWHADSLPPRKPWNQHTCYLTFRRMLSCIPFFVTPWTPTCQAPLSMETSRQAYWRGLPFPFPGDLPDPRIELVPLASLACKISNF